MKRIKGFEQLVRRNNGGELLYHLWNNDEGALYVQIVKNFTKSGKRGGSHSNLIYLVSDYLDVHSTGEGKWNLVGLDPKTFKRKTSKDNNDAAFLKAVFEHLFPKSTT